MKRLVLLTCVFALLGAMAVVAARQQPPARQADANAVAIDADDIGGVVTGPNGPEAGVWVIAEAGLGTKFRKIVVTDDRGRFVVPDLPAATYRLWVRGYGLVDSAPVQSGVGRAVALSVTPAPNARAAAEIYPANYWYSLIQVPPKSEFPGTGPTGNGINPNMRTQAHWLQQMKTGCEVCHQLGTKATRAIPKSLGVFDSSAAAWDHRMQVGQDGNGMSNGLNNFGRTRGLAMYADWTDRITAGEVPQAPPRPQGVERNVVLTQWDWGVPSSFVHDEVSTDKRAPTLNANGPIYGIDYGNDLLLTVDPVRNTVTQLRIPVRDANTPPSKSQTMPRPSPYWGTEIYWTDPSAPNNLMLDTQGRLWMASTIRNFDNPSWCASHPSAKISPVTQASRHVTYYDPKTKAFKLFDTCFSTHHIRFANDRDQTLYINDIRNGMIGWVKTRILDETGDERAAQGWCKGYFDVNGDGRIDPAVDQPVNMNGVYSVIPNPLDGSVWGGVPGVPGRVVRIDPNTCVTEAYEPPFNNPKMPNTVAFSPRGIDIDTNGVIWSALGSGHTASFDRRKCAVRAGAAATTGQHCPEGWTLYPTPGPKFRGVDDQIAADHHYYNWVDQFDTLGLGRNVPIANGTGSDSLLALQPNGQFVVMRVPYPLGFFQRGLDGRIDDPRAGWKGRAVYANYGPNSIWHAEGGKGTLSALVKFQIRPNPLAK